MVAESLTTIPREGASPTAQHMSLLGIDIATLVFHVVGMDDSGPVVLWKRLARSAWVPFIANVPPLRIGMEACGSAHDWARCFHKHGHEVRLMASPSVKASVKPPKHETCDAEAICEAVTRPTMRFVRIQHLEQPDIHALHRVRRGSSRPGPPESMRSAGS
jgi:transposase